MKAVSLRFREPTTCYSPQNPGGLESSRSSHLWPVLPMPRFVVYRSHESVCRSMSFEPVVADVALKCGDREVVGEAVLVVGESGFCGEVKSRKVSDETVMEHLLFWISSESALERQKHSIFFRRVDECEIEFGYIL